MNTYIAIAIGDWDPCTRKIDPFETITTFQIQAKDNASNEDLIRLAALELDDSYMLREYTAIRIDDSDGFLLSAVVRKFETVDFEVETFINARMERCQPTL